MNKGAYASNARPEKSFEWSELLLELETNPKLRFITDSPRYFSPDLRVKHAIRGGGGSYHPRKGIVVSGTAKWYTYVHEYAHHAAGLLVEYPHQPHGPEFAAVLGRIIEALWGRAAEHEYLQSLYKNKADYDADFMYAASSTQVDVINERRQAGFEKVETNQKTFFVPLSDKY
jgi:hypothetical protein